MQVRQNVLDMTLHITQYSNIIADLRDEIRRLRQKLDQQPQQQQTQKQGAVTMATGYHSYQYTQRVVMTTLMLSAERQACTGVCYKTFRP